MVCVLTPRLLFIFRIFFRKAPYRRIRHLPGDAYPVPVILHISAISDCGRVRPSWDVPHAVRVSAPSSCAKGPSPPDIFHGNSRNRSRSRHQDHIGARFPRNCFILPRNDLFPASDRIPAACIFPATRTSIPNSFRYSASVSAIAGW